MTLRFRIRQALTIARIELRRAFFSRRALWVYVLALLPAVIFLARGAQVKVMRQRWGSPGIVAAALIDNAKNGESEEDVIKRLGRPGRDSARIIRKVHRVPTPDGRSSTLVIDKPVRERRMTYFDGNRIASFTFSDGSLHSRQIYNIINFEQSREIFAGLFQYYYLRLAVFFGCVGIFMNLFRGEMLDKTLHYWFLAPARRDVLFAGKYGAGLLASSVIFATGALLAFFLMMWPNDPSQVHAYWAGAGMGHAFWYAAAAVLGCVGYGSVFLAAGLLLKNPVVPAAMLVIWENVQGFLPAILQRLTVLHYLESICPVPAPVDKSIPSVLRLLLAPATPASRLGATLGLLVFTAVVLWVGSIAVRRIQISYGTE